MKSGNNLRFAMPSSLSNKAIGYMSGYKTDMIRKFLDLDEIFSTVDSVINIVK
jgi:hypothetical protein